MDNLKNRYVSLGGSQKQMTDPSLNLRFDADYDYLLKMVIVGDCCVGKSALLRRYAAGEYPMDSYISTIGVDFSIGRFKIDNSDGKIKLQVQSNKKITNIAPHPLKIKLQIWDTAGQERFRSITQSYYRGMKLCILCFDSTTTGQPGSITTISKWLNDIKKYAGENVNVYVIGTKADSPDASIMNPDMNALNYAIKDIENYPGLNVRFMGWCSSKMNAFVKNLNDIDHLTKVINIDEEDHCVWSSDKIRKNPDLKNKTVPTIADMFELITFDFLRRAADLSRDFEFRHLNTCDLGAESNNPIKQSCCNIL